MDFSRPSIADVQRRLGIDVETEAPRPRVDKRYGKPPANKIEYDDCNALGCDRPRKMVRTHDGYDVRHRFCGHHICRKRKYGEIPEEKSRPGGPRGAGSGLSPRADE